MSRRQGRGRRAAGVRWEAVPHTASACPDVPSALYTPRISLDELRTTISGARWRVLPASWRAVGGYGRLGTPRGLYGWVGTGGVYRVPPTHRPSRLHWYCQGPTTALPRCIARDCTLGLCLALPATLRPSCPGLA